MCDFEVPKLIWYSSAPSLVLSIVFGFFILNSNRKNPVNKNLFIFIILFCFWLLNATATWFVYDPLSNLLLERLAVLEVISLLFFIYFIHDFIGKRINVKIKLLYFIPFIPILVLLFTNENVALIDEKTCQTQLGRIYWYVYLLAFVYITWAVKLLLSCYRDRNTGEKKKKQIQIIAKATIFLVFWFLSIVLIRNWFVSIGYESSDDIALFIPIGMVVFIGMLTYAISRYKLFNIRLLFAQAVVIGLIFLVGSQLFFNTTIASLLLTGATLLLTMGFGWMLVRSVKEEVRRKEELQEISDKLASANEKLRQLDNAKSEFISIASHQLRTPLTAIKGFVSLLLEGAYGKISKPVQETLNKVSMSNNRLMLLVENLLNISRIEAGRIQYQFAEGHIEDLIKELTDAFALPVKEKGLVLSTDLPKEKLPAIVFDYGKIREVLSNLIDNAIKYTPEGSITIAAKTVPDGVTISVTDTGLGIEADDLSRLFGKFERGKHSTRVNVSSTGLGLYVGKSFVEAHGGTIAVTSPGVGKGSCFTVTLPLTPKS